MKCVECYEEKSAEAGKEVPTYFGRQFVCSQCFEKKVKKDLVLARTDFIRSKTDPHQPGGGQAVSAQENFAKEIALEVTKTLDKIWRDRINDTLDEIAEHRRKYKQDLEEWASVANRYYYQRKPVPSELKRPMMNRLHASFKAIYDSLISLCDVIIECVDRKSVVCSKCGSMMPTHARFCGKCGAALPG